VNVHNAHPTHILIAASERAGLVFGGLIAILNGLRGLNISGAQDVSFAEGWSR